MSDGYPCMESPTTLEGWRDWGRDWCEEAKKLKDECKRLRGLLRQAWYAYAKEPWPSGCPHCYEKQGEPHDDDCPMLAVDLALLADPTKGDDHVDHRK